MARTKPTASAKTATAAAAKGDGKGRKTRQQTKDKTDSVPALGEDESKSVNASDSDDRDLFPSSDDEDEEQPPVRDRDRNQAPSGAGGGGGGDDDGDDDSDNESADSDASQHLHWSGFNMNDEKWKRRMADILKAIEFTQAPIKFMVKDGLDHPNKLHTLKEKELDMFVKNCRKNLPHGEICGTSAVINLKKCSFVMTHMLDRTSRGVNYNEIDPKWCASLDEQHDLEETWDDGNDPLATTDKRGVANISELSASVNRLHEKIDNLPANDAEGTRDTASVTGGSNRDNSALVRQPPNKKMKT